MVWLVLILLIFANPFAEDRILGGYAGWVERMGSGPREAARGNTSVSDIQAMPSAWSNPAVTALNRKTTISMHGEQRSLDRQGGSLGFSQPIGSRMGLGLGILYRGDSDFKVVDEEDSDLGTAQPFFMMGYIGLGLRTSTVNAFGLGLSFAYENLDVNRFYEDSEIVDEFQTPVLLSFSWFRKLNKRFDAGVYAGNIGLNEKLSGSYRRNLSRDNSLRGEKGFFPKTLRAGLTYHTQIAGLPTDLSLEVRDYQLADSLLVFDSDVHALRAGTGLEVALWQGGALRLGWDHDNAILGAGHSFIMPIQGRKVPLMLNYAMVFEGEAGLINPFSLGMRFEW
jgi:hypothetical protein